MPFAFMIFGFLGNSTLKFSPDKLLMLAEIEGTLITEGPVNGEENEEFLTYL